MSGFVIRSIFSVLTVIYTLASLYACTPTQEQQPIALPLEDIPVEQSSNVVYILQSRPEISQSLQEALDFYKSINPGAVFSLQTVGNQMDYQVALRAKMLSGDQVDVFHLFSNQEVREMSVNLEDISDMEWVHGCLDNMIDPVSVDNRIYGIPYSVECYGILANRNIFEISDIPLGGIVTYEDLAESFENLQQMIWDGELVEDFPDLRYVTDIPAGDKTYLGGIVANTLLTDSFQRPSEAAEAQTFAAPRHESAKKLIDLLESYSPRIDWDDLQNVSQTSQIDRFAEGEIAVLLADIGSYDRILSINPELENRIALLPVPLENQPNSMIYTTAPAYWVIRQDSVASVKEEAKKLLTWLYQSETGTAIVAGDFGAASAYRDTAKETGNSLQNQMLSYIQRDKSLPQMQQEFPQDWGSTVFAGNLRQYYMGEIDWDDLIEDCVRKWSELRYSYSN